jgi:hypothetical protein
MKMAVVDSFKSGWKVRHKHSAAELMPRSPAASQAALYILNISPSRTARADHDANPRYSLHLTTEIVTSTPLPPPRRKQSTLCRRNSITLDTTSSGAS